MTLTWTVWRGPASVRVESDSDADHDVQDRHAVITATFTAPGEYILRAQASDGHLTDVEELSVTVNAAR